MKKLLGILVLGLLWCNTSFANIDDLNIPITKAEVETEIIKPNKEYRQSCETGVTVEQSYIDIKFNSYIDGVGKKQTLVQEIIFDMDEDGKIIMKSQQKIKSDGTLSKVKASSDYIPGSVEYSKKEIKQVKKMFKAIAKYFDERAINYGEKLTLGIKREDAKKKMLKIFKDFESVFVAAGEDPKEVKEFMKILKKDSRFEMIKEYLGTTELNGEKFYAVRWDATFEYVGNIPEMKEALEETSFNSVYFIHAPSGYRSAVQMTVEETDPSTEVYEDMICTIYKNDQMLTEVSISELEDKAVAKKTETKETKKKAAKKKEVSTENKEVTWTAYAGKDDRDLPSGSLSGSSSNFKKKAIVRFGTSDQQNIFNEVVSKAINKCKVRLNFIKDKECHVFRIKYSDKYGEQDAFSGSIKSALDIDKIKVKWEGISGEITSKKIKVAKKEKKKEPTQTDDSNDIIQQIKDLNELYKSGALTKEQFTKAKKKLLN